MKRVSPRSVLMVRAPKSLQLARIAPVVFGMLSLEKSYKYYEDMKMKSSLALLIMRVIQLSPVLKITPA